MRLVRSGSESHIDSDHLNPKVRKYTWKTILERRNKNKNSEKEKVDLKNNQKSVKKQKEKSLMSSRNDLTNESNVVFCTADSCNPSMIKSSNGQKFGLDAYDYKVDFLISFKKSQILSFVS